MKGNTINEFISDLRTNGGPEKEFIYGDKSYIIQAENKNSDKNHICDLISISAKTKKPEIIFKLTSSKV